MKHNTKNKFFQNERSFEDFINRLSPQNIQKMKYQDWIWLYEHMDDMREKHQDLSLLKTIALGAAVRATGHIYNLVSKFIPAMQKQKHNRFTDKHNEAFVKLYTNYKMEEADKKTIINMAFQCADTFISHNPNGDKYATDRIDSIKPAHKKKIAKQIRNSIYQNVYSDDILSRIYMPKIKIKKPKSKKTYGQYIPAIHRIEISAYSNAGVSTIAHENLHSVQGVSIGSHILKLLDHRYSCDDKMSKLYAHNTDYYFNSLCIKGENETYAEYKKRRRIYFQAYRQQPMEYAARLFGTMFKYRLREHAKFPQRIMSILEHYGFQVETHRKTLNTQITLEMIMPAMSGIRYQALQELNSKYLLSSLQHTEDGKIKLSFNCSVDNQKRIKEEATYFNYFAKRYKHYPNQFIAKTLPDTAQTIRAIKNQQNLMRVNKR